jgi:aerobic C4-dicarboxylate transport protein
MGIDRFMSEARAVTNFAGNSVATLLVAQWTHTLDRAQLDRVLSGEDRFDETTMVDDHDTVHDEPAVVGASR